MFKDYLRKKFINWLVGDLFNALYPEEILRFDGGNVFYKGKKMNEEQVSELVDGSDRFSSSVIWKMLSEDAIYNANLVMYQNSKDFGGMMFGKAVLYAIDILKQRMAQLSKLKK